ncbi:MAG: hypothetical protein QM809_11885 [Gordonia sp. (in: high G+C Gram-positive bacteria)]|uniref:hypothetical protein n=1 Tax=Gordonia sp. (in: high G+C Gram-positive bacteria) TaxID=84139 RepID=UPI0039E5FB81
MSSDSTSRDQEEPTADAQSADAVTENDTDAVDVDATEEVSTAKAADPKPAAKKTSAKKPAAKGNAAKKPAAAKASAEKDDSASAAKRSGEFTVTTAMLVRAGVALLAVAAVVVVGLLSWQYFAKSRQLSAFEESKSASSHYVKTYFETMMKPGASEKEIKDVMLPLSTGEARERLDQEAKSSVELVKQAKMANVKVDIGIVTVESFSSSKATTVLTGELEGTSAVAPEGGKDMLLFELHLEKKDGEWLVGQMTPVQGVSAATSGQQSGSPQLTQAPQPTG